MNLKAFIYGICLVNFLIVFHTAVSKVEGRCKKSRKYSGTPLVERGSMERLDKITITCTCRGIIFEVRYSNGSLCACGHLKKANVRHTFMCQEKLSSLDITVNVSTNHVKIRKERCDVSLYFDPFTDRAFIPRPIEIMRPLRPRPTEKLPPTARNESAERLVNSDDMIYIAPSKSSIISSGAVAFQATTRIDYEASASIPVVRTNKSEFSTPARLASYESIPNTLFLPTSMLKATQSIYHTPVLSTSKLQPNIVKTISTPIEPSSSMLNVLTTTSLSPIAKKQRQFREDVEFISNFNTSTVDIDDKETIERVLVAATNLIATNETLEDQKKDPGMQAVEVLEDLGNSISQQLDLGSESSVTFQKVTKELVFGAAVINTTSSEEFSFPSKEEKNIGDEKITIPSSVFNNRNNPEKAYFVGIIFKAYPEMRNNTGGLTLGTKVINAIVEPPPSDLLDEPVTMMFRKNVVRESSASECSFWEEDNLDLGANDRWSTRGCSNTFENQTHIKCSCSHLTNFAVLFKISNDQEVSEQDTYRLVIITYIGLGLSILGCLLTFIFYIALQNIKSERAAIHTNLVLALGLADVIFLITIAVKPSGDSCLALAMFAFYFYLAVFFWMLVEGVYIYLMVIKVFRGNVARKRRLAYLMGWGCPLLIAIITWAVLGDGVISKYHCWLSVETGAIWAFVGPGLIIILVNCCILLAVIKTTWATFSDKTEYGGLKSASKTFGAVIPILGITWVFGVMAFNESSIVFQYIFAITNSIQGALIFVLYCLVNQEVRNELHRRISVWKTRRDMSSSSGFRRQILMSTQSAKGTQEVSHDPPQELKKKNPERNSLLDDAMPTETTKGSENTDNAHPNGKRDGRDSPVKNNTIVENSWDSVGYV